MNPKRKQPTAEQRKRREYIDRRNAALQRAAIKPPKSNIFGGVKAEKKKDGQRGR